MRFYRKARRPPVINIVSLIDILVLLLIFFVVTTTFKSEEPVVTIKLPQSETAATAAPEVRLPLTINITEQNEVFLGGTPASSKPDELAAAIKARIAAEPGLKLAMRADSKANFGVVIQVLDALKKAGVKDVPAFTAPVSTKEAGSP